MPVGLREDREGAAVLGDVSCQDAACFEDM